MDNLDLFGAPESVTKYQSHSASSKDSARHIEASAKTLRARVLQFLMKTRGGATDEQIQERLQMNPNTQRPRRVELVEKGLIRDSGTVRKTSSGRNATVWEVIND